MITNINQLKEAQRIFREQTTGLKVRTIDEHKGLKPHERQAINMTEQMHIKMLCAVNPR